MIVVKFRDITIVENYFNNRKKLQTKPFSILIRNAYFCAWNFASLNFNQKINYHMKQLGIEIGDHYLDDTAARDMVLSLSYTIQNSLRKSIVSTGSFVSLMIDESIDNSHESKLLLLLRYCDGTQPKEKYLSILKLQPGTAESIFNKAWNALLHEDFMDKLILVLGDNAPVIQGKIGGVIALFKEKINHLKEGRCIAHLNNLIVKNMVESIKKVSLLKNFVYKMVDYIQKSSFKKELFKQIQEEQEQYSKSLICPFDIRWSSFYFSLSRIIEVYPSLVNTFNHLSEEGLDATATGYLIKLTDLETLSLILILEELLQPFSKSDEGFQLAELTVGEALEKANQLKDNLCLLFRTETDYGYWLGCLKSEFETSQTFHGVPITNKKNLEFSALRILAVEYRDQLHKLLIEKFEHLEKYTIFNVLDFCSLIKEKEIGRTV